MRYILLIILLFIISCDNIEPPRCQIESWIIDDCGICRECELEECNWNETMNTCGGCDNDLSSCTGCMDPEAINTEVDMIIHDGSTCDYDNFINEPDVSIFNNDADYANTAQVNTQITNTVTKEFVEDLGIDESKVTMDAKLEEDLEIDSLGIVEVVMAFEDEFEIEIDDEELADVKTVGQAVNLLHSKI